MQVSRLFAHFTTQEFLERIHKVRYIMFPVFDNYCDDNQGNKRIVTLA